MLPPADTETVSAAFEPPPLPSPLTPGERFAGRFVVHREVGRGGFAVVYEAFDEAAGEAVALKVLRADRLGPAVLQRFAREAALARDLAHPHLVAVRDAGADGQTAWLAMELVPGGSLRARMAAGPLPVEEAIALARQALAGLGALHAAGLVHRDVKPSNLLFTADGTLKLADFGLVRSLAAEETQATSSSALVGTLGYLSPEQALGDPVDGRSDLYALGVVLFEALSGEPLHEGRSTLGALLTRLKDPLPDLAHLRPEVPGWLVALVEKLLAREPAARYPTAAAALADLDRRRGPRRATARLRRRRLALAAALGLLAAATAAALWWSARPRFDRVVAESPTAVRAVDARGRTLWRREGIRTDRNFVPVRLAAGGPLRLATVLASGTEVSYPASRTISFLDPLTGEVVDQVVAPSADRLRFDPALADTFGAELRAHDFDGDGVDELLATFLHDPFYPSYTVLHEPRWRRTRVLLAASGHHSPAAFADLDGDGREEVLLAGYANRLGWQIGLAAVRIDPPVSDERGERGIASPAESPDRLTRSNEEASALLWYALGPPGALSARDRDLVTVDEARRQLALHLTVGRPPLFTFDGFPADEPAPPGSAAARNAARRTAWSAAREALRLIQAGYPGDGAAKAVEAVAAAGAAGDRRLGLWARRVEARALARAGRFAEAEPRFVELLAATGDDIEVAFEAGQAYAFAGVPARAADWFRRGFGPGGGLGRGRNRYEFLEGLLFARLELGDFDGAASEVERAVRIHPEIGEFSSYYRQMVRWRRGERPEIDPLDPSHTSIPLFAYWRLEFRLARGESPAALLGELPAVRARASGTAALLLSFEAEARRRLGEPERALSLAREAVDRAAAEADVDLAVRGHRPLLAARLAALERDARGVTEGERSAPPR